MTDKPIKRALKPPKTTFFLLGPRATGKSTWLKQEFPNAHRIDLLKSSEYLRLKTDPSLLRAEVFALPADSWVIIDEIQKLTILLDEVHALIFDTDNKYRFALSGSSARKLKKEQANLLAGRALTRQFFPLSCTELGAGFNLQQALRFGVLPAVWNLNTDIERIEYLDAYVETYLKEEIQQEALVRGLDSFYRFLSVSALCNAQVLSISNVARDVGVARSTAQGYFDILRDTLLGWFLPAYRPRAKVKEIAHTKFYFFDCGVVRALRHETRRELQQPALGHLFETWFLNEIRIMNQVHSLGAEFYYWQAEHGTEVDLVLITGNRRIGFEIKGTSSWSKEYNKGLQCLLEEKVIDEAYGVYLGDRALVIDSIKVLPYLKALEVVVDQSNPSKT